MFADVAVLGRRGHFEESCRADQVAAAGTPLLVYARMKRTQLHPRQSAVSLNTHRHTRIRLVNSDFLQLHVRDGRFSLHEQALQCCCDVFVVCSTIPKRRWDVVLVVARKLRRGTVACSRRRPSAGAGGEADNCILRLVGSSAMLALLRAPPTRIPLHVMQASAYSLSSPSATVSSGPVRKLRSKWAATLASTSPASRAVFLAQGPAMRMASWANTIVAEDGRLRRRSRLAR